MVKLLATLACCVGIGLVAVGCGDDEDEESGGGGGASSEQPANSGGGGGAAKATVAVKMEGIQYVPKEVRVKVGGTVNWTNTDTPTHTVTKESGPGPKFDSGNMEPGAKFSRKFPRAGVVEYVCTIHPNQTGTVTVE